MEVDIFAPTRRMELGALEVCNPRNFLGVTRFSEASTGVDNSLRDLFALFSSPAVAQSYTIGLSGVVPFGADYGGVEDDVVP